MKKTLLLLASVALLLVGCQKENFVEQQEGKLVDATFTASLESGVATRAAVDGDGAAASVNRCIMEIYYGDALYARQYAPVNDQKKATFTAQVVSNRTYTVAFWADKVDATTEAGLKVDKYYTTTNGLKAIELKGTYAGNNDARDAFFVCAPFTVQQAGGSFTATLKRPFAQVNVITTDLQIIKPVPALKPEGVDVLVKNAYTGFNVLTGTVSTPSNLTYTAALYNFPETIGTQTDATLSMDYLFASADKAVIDIDWKALHGTDADVAHSFAAVPYQRNYRTNIKGALLTTQGQWTVTVNPAWAGDDIDFPVYEATVDNIEALNTVLASDKAQAADEVIVTTTMPNDSDTKNVVFTTANNDQVVSLTFENGLGTNKTITFKNDGQEATQGPANLNIVAPSGTSLVFDNPMTHVVINGTSYENISGTFSANSLIIGKDITVKKLVIAAGGLEIHGIVNEVEVTGTTQNVFVRSCEGLSETVYNVLKEYIAIEYEGVKNGSTYDIVLKNEWTNFAAKSFSDISANTINIANVGELALFAKEFATYHTYNVNLKADIDLSGRKWTPMGDDKCQFTGVFDGCGHKIVGMNIDVNRNYTAFIGDLNGTIKNVTFENAAVVNQATDYTAVIAGRAPLGVIENCAVKGGSVQGKEQVAALVGYMSSATISGCVVDGVSLSGVNRVGGITGKIQINNQAHIIGNSVKNSTITSSGKHDLSGAAGIAAQIMSTTLSELESNHFEIKDNIVENVTTTTGSDSKLVPVGEFRGTENLLPEHANYITDNSWYPADTYYYDMVNPSNAQQKIRIFNAGADPVAKIGDKKYVTLQAALEGAKDNDVILLCMDIIRGVQSDNSDRETYVISDKTVTIDLNGHTIKHRYGLNKSGVFEVKNSTLTIDDSSTEKNGKIADTYAQAVLHVENSTINLKNGILAAEYTSTSSTNYRVVKLKNSTFNMDGGSVLAATTGNYNRAFEFVHSTGTNSKVIVNNGVIKTFTSYGVVFYGDSGGYNGENNVVEINGGEISTVGNFGWLGDDVFGEIVMNGGSFTSNWHQVVDSNTKFTHNGGTVNIKTK